MQWGKVTLIWTCWVCFVERFPFGGVQYVIPTLLRVFPLLVLFLVLRIVATEMENKGLLFPKVPKQSTLYKVIEDLTRNTLNSQ